MLSVIVPEGFRAYVETTLTRLGYLHPSFKFRYDSGLSEIQAECSGEGVDEDLLRKEILYQLYREKILLDTLPIRKRLYGAA